MSTSCAHLELRTDVAEISVHAFSATKSPHVKHEREIPCADRDLCGYLGQPGTHQEEDSAETVSELTRARKTGTEPLSGRRLTPDQLLRKMQRSYDPGI